MMISRSATEAATQACSEAAIRASPIHSADANQTLSIANLLLTGSGFRTKRHAGKIKPAGRRVTDTPPPRVYAAGVISPSGGYGELHPRKRYIAASWHLPALAPRVLAANAGTPAC